MRLAGLAAHMGEKRCVQSFVGKLEGKRPRKDSGVDGKII